MREFVKISQTLWKSKKFKALPSDDARYCYLYILTCPHSNSAGCFDLPPDYIATDLRWGKDRCIAALQTLCEAALIQFDGDEETILLENWFEFNSPANPKHAVGMLAQLKQVSCEKLKWIRGEEIKAVIIQKKFDKEQMVRACLASFFNGFYTVSSPRLDQDVDQTETKTETRRDLDLDLREGAQTALRLCAEVRSPAPLDETKRAYEKTTGVSPQVIELAKRIGAIN